MRSRGNPGVAEMRKMVRDFHDFLCCLADGDAVDRAGYKGDWGARAFFAGEINSIACSVQTGSVQPWPDAFRRFAAEFFSVAAVRALFAID